MNALSVLTKNKPISIPLRFDERRRDVISRRVGAPIVWKAYVGADPNNGVVTSGGGGQVGDGIVDFIGSPLVRTVSMGVNLYHGYMRTQSIGWALGWGFLGWAFPVVSTIFAFAMKPGFAKRAR